jgi:hypothetical protein
MRNHPTEDRSSHANVVLKYLAGTMAVLYIISGTAILLTYRSEDFKHIYQNLGPYPWGLGIALLLYGLFRGYKVYQQYFQPKAKE